MPPRNSQINVTFEETTVNFLSMLARQEHKSLASLVRELTLESLARREDFYLSNLAEKIDIKGEKTYSHEAAWK